jgi:cobalt-zinc-cadmium efflux system membrane fusion protein
MMKPLNNHYCRSALMVRIWIMVIMVMLGGCGETQSVAPAKVEIADPDVVTITPSLTKVISLQAAGNTEVRENLRIPGTIQLDEQRVSRIGASVIGRLKEIEVALGENVRQGQVLATLNSTELAQHQLAYVKASQQIALQSKAVERARQLLEADVIGSAELQRRESELHAAQAELNAARDQLMVLGMSERAIRKLEETGQIGSYSNVVTKVSGTVISRKVNLGQVVQPADELFIVADLSRVWVEAEVPEQQIDLVEVGEDVLVEIPALGNRQYTATLIYEADIVNPQTRTVTVRSVIDNPDREIKPDMLVSMLIKSRPVTRLAIPAQSIVRENDKTYVFVKFAPDKFRLREVELGSEFEGKAIVIRGLSQGEVIVNQGAFHVNNERKSKELG